ncbi:tetratricopeptide repeat protein [Hydrogenophaga sp. PAMC20947]|uniref:tetratricopeptide repeat protein n=1 Tax=Hydrogenophaga sp. PAMC20947 TaxID=2565558 RepID=UPI00109DE9A9|nr:tetratricopeptide repeat protein [Hydrogenophaga sp. PAMC20947]QCB45316.1 hypothetical protein E5678_04315 [Hydrogenophaga sp. PAMC20947]
MLGPGEEAGSLCIQSEVLYGEVAVPSGAISTSMQRSAPDAQASVRVQVTQPVNEPIVTVVVRVGCSAPFSRRFVLLADPISEPLAAGGALIPSTLPAVRLPPLAAETRLNARASRSDRDPVSADGDASGGTNTASAATRKKPEPQRSRPASVVRKPAPEATPPATPRLQLDPVDLSLAIERDPVLRLSLAMLSEPTTSEEERAAAGLLWKAINATPEEILRDSQKLAVLEAESKGLREQEKQDRAAITAMKSQLDSTRYMTWLAYVFGALFLLSLAALLWLSRRRKAEQATDDRGAWYAGATKPARTARAAAASAGVLEVREEPQGIDIDLNLDGDFDDYQSLHDSSMALIDGVPASSGQAKSGAGGAGASTYVSRSVATEELFDVQQQADFFVSLGEYDQAIGVLKGHLAESQEPGALAYLDLFRIYHQLGRHDEYEQLREEFNLQFNAGAPPFENYSDDSKGLESYETAFGRIQALWPQPRVLDVIEKSIFKEPNDPDGEVFDLEAYRELLLLHAVAKEMISRDIAELPEQVDFEHTAIKPLKAAAPRKVVSGFGALTDMAGQTVPQEDVPHASPRLGLDVDLDALSEMSAFEASLPEVPVAVEPSSKPTPPRGTVQEEGNLIDFEVLDFMPPDEPGVDLDLDGEKKAD